MVRSFTRLCLTAAVVGVSITSANAALVITEAMSSSGTGGTPDWFELTNTGPSSIDLTGYKMDDSSFAFANSVALNGVGVVPAGTSVVFVETDAPATDLPAFRTFWGGTALTTQVGSYPSAGLGVGLSSSADGVIVFDAAGTEAAPRVSFTAATTGSSFIRAGNGTTGAFGTVSVVGVNGAFQSAAALANVGSPGTIAVTPEPATLASLLAVGLVARRRRSI